MRPLLVVTRTAVTRTVRRRRFAYPLQTHHHHRHHRCIGNSSTTPPASNKATDDTITVDGTDPNPNTTLAAQCIQPRPIFPWRSSPDPLPRLIKPTKPTISTNATDDDEVEKSSALLFNEYYDSDYFTKGGPLGPGWISPMEPWFRAALYGNSMRLLGESWPSVLMPWTRKDWEHEMAWNFCHAFSNGVQGMVEDTYILNDSSDNDANIEVMGSNNDEVDEQESYEYDVNLDATLDPLPLEEKVADKTNGNISSINKHGEEIGKHDEKYSMLQRNLRQLYQSARQHSHPSKVNIVLKTVPQSAVIESMFPVFGLSRTLVEDHPNLRHTYRNLMSELNREQKEAIQSGKKRLNPIEVGSFIMRSLLDVLERSSKLSGDGNATITIVAQVSINCKEIFCVRDVESGEILQGYEDGQPRDVTHLVRFEMVVREDLHDDGEDMKIGRWQISDWDDLLDGNVFFT